MNSLFSIVVLIFVVCEVQSFRHDLKGCKVVADTVTTCSGVVGTGCDSVTLAALLAAGTTQVNVCQKRSTTLTKANIVVTFRAHKTSYSTLGLTSVCFLPLTTETRTCDVLAADNTFVKLSCTDQTSLIGRLASNNARICLLDTKVTPNVYKDKTVQLFAKLNLPRGH